MVEVAGFGEETAFGTGMFGVPMTSPLRFDTEMAVQRRLTKAFIDTKPEVVIFTPLLKQKTSGGGVRTILGSPRDPLVVRVNEPGDSGQRYPVRTSEGLQRAIDYLIIAEWDAIIEVDDVFVYHDKEFVIAEVLHDNGYETRAMAVRHGW